MVMDIKTCPFCGSIPNFPLANSVRGTTYDAGCEECGIAAISIQIIDCVDYSQRHDVDISWDNASMKYADKYYEIARNYAIERWNTRSEV